jgi:hypothetical protein
MCESEKGVYQIDTPDGWKDINFLVKKTDKECFDIKMEEGMELECSSSHNIFTNNGWKEAKDIDIQRDLIQTRNGMKKVISKKYSGIKDTFDLQVDSEESRYYSNDIVSHNCGKSLVCKAISSYWNMPLLRLDFGKLFGSLVGDSEKNAREAIRLAEAVAPSILWIDEIEKAISGVRSSGQSDGGTTSRVLSTFLTWMQEKTSSVFVVATANDHESIPPEFLRPGRFDEIFWVDLPNIKEREEILEVHLKRRGLDPKDFNLAAMAVRGDGYSGAELEKSITEAMVVGFSDKKRKIKTEDIINAMGTFKPLSVMREGDFEAIREWSETRCRSANEKAVETVNMGSGYGEKDLDI